MGRPVVVGGVEMALAVDTPAHLRLMRSEELAARLHVRPNTLRWWVRRHGMPVVKLGRLVRFRPGDVAMWLEESGNRRAWQLCGLMRNELAALGRPGDAERVRKWIS